jgi:hypothetical protein
MPKEDLLSQEVRQQRRALTLAWSAAGALTILVALAGWLWQDALAQRNRAEKTLSAATETTNGLVNNLAVRFRNVTGGAVIAGEGYAGQRAQPPGSAYRLRRD